MKYFLAGIVMCLVAAGCAATGTAPHRHDAFTRHFEESRFQVTDKGMYSVEMVVKEHELKTGVNTVDLIVHDRNDRDVVGARVEVTPWMPDMGHGVFEKPVITEKGGGLYTVENIILTMSGRWELRVAVRSDTMGDSTVFDFPDVKVDRGHDHKSPMTAAPSDLDLSSSKLSEKGTFRVSYESKLDPIPINTIQAWTLRIETPEGNPVEGARISVDGDMPEHGHGLPTQPEATEYLGNGAYLIEGLKFSMPGWWVIKFNIASGGMQDIAAFNLFLKE